MRLKLTLAALAALTSAFGLTVSPVGYVIKAGDVSFDYPHPYYGVLDGLIEAKTSYAYGAQISQRFDRFTLSAEALYIRTLLKRVVVGGKEKNWGDEASGWGAGVKLGYDIIPVEETLLKSYGLKSNWRLTPTVGIGYQDLLGGGATASVGIELGKKISENCETVLVVQRQYAADTTYEGLTMHKEPSTLVGLRLDWRF